MTSGVAISSSWYIIQVYAVGVDGDPSPRSHPPIFHYHTNGTGIAPPYPRFAYELGGGRTPAPSFPRCPALNPLHASVYSAAVCRPQLLWEGTAYPDTSQLALLSLSLT
eukprot:759105-Hanusia_phi.AAC.2